MPTGRQEKHRRLPQAVTAAPGLTASPPEARPHGDMGGEGSAGGLGMPR